MLRVALTGGIGSGKSFVAEYFKKLGIPVFHADEVAKALYSEPEVLEFVDHLTHGRAVQRDLEGKARVDFPSLAQIIFSDPALRHTLEAFIHPRVRARFQEFCQAHKQAPYVLSEAALYFETGLWKEFDAVILVTAPEKMRLERLVRQRGMAPEEAEKRMKSQWPDEKKRPLATFHILNDGRRDPIPQVQEIHRRLLNGAISQLIT